MSPLKGELPPKDVKGEETPIHPLVAVMVVVGVERGKCRQKEEMLEIQHLLPSLTDISESKSSFFHILTFLEVCQVRATQDSHHRLQ